MLRYALGLLMIAVGATSAAAQSTSGWMLAEQILEDGGRALVLSREQPRGRAEYRVLHEWRRSAGIYGSDCYNESSGTQSAVQSERLADARDRLAARIGSGPCSFDPDVLDGFDVMFARLEEMARTIGLPDVQAWVPDAAGYRIRRDAGIDISISFEPADLNYQRQGDIEVTRYDLNCPRRMLVLESRAAQTGDLATRIAAARQATEAQVRAALAQCPHPQLSAERLMAGFDEALALAEARLAADASRR